MNKLEEFRIVVQVKLDEVKRIINVIESYINNNILPTPEETAIPLVAQKEDRKFCCVVDRTESSKLGQVAATYAPMSTCDSSCPFKDKGCYAQLGHCAFTVNRINEHSKGQTLRMIAQEEASKIVQLPGDVPLRLHISGDCRTPEAAKILAEAARVYTAKNGQPVWTYTHSWRLIPRKNWGSISVFASCETFKDVKYANSRGYAACMVRYKPFEKPFFNKDDRYIMIPCKEQVKGITCKDCLLCVNDKSLLEKKTIVCFFAHGARKESVKRTLLKRT